MIPLIKKIRFLYTKEAHFKARIEKLYAMMDSRYDEAASCYKFQCNGCEDNCCLTRFYHHTYIEFLYILDGFETLEYEKRVAIKNRARNVCEKSHRADTEGVPVKLLCPLNTDSLCTLYPYRPMICRLHGLPHELTGPEQGGRHHPGCDYFMKQNAYKDYFRFDRTSIYTEMANLERDFRQKAGLTDKIKMTIAEMIDRYDF